MGSTSDLFHAVLGSLEIVVLPHAVFALQRRAGCAARLAADDIHLARCLDEVVAVLVEVVVDLLLGKHQRRVNEVCQLAAALPHPAVQRRVAPVHQNLCIGIRARHERASAEADPHVEHRGEEQCRSCSASAQRRKALARRHHAGAPPAVWPECERSQRSL